LTIIVEESRRIYHHPKLAHVGSDTRGALQAFLVQKIDRWRSFATKTNDILEATAGVQTLNQRTPYTAVGTKNDSDTVLWK
jgi:hypothetical protein